MNLGIIGKGVVGTAIKKGFEDIGHTVSYHDIKHNTRIEDVLESEIIYVTVGTPSNDKGYCDISSVVSVVQELANLKYKGILAIKSTIIPGTYSKLKKIFDEERLCTVPEFLREKHAIEDFKNNHNVLVIGTNNQICADKVVESHGDYPKAVYTMTPEECEFVKYFSNVFKAVKVTFANSFGKICDKFNVDYEHVMLAYSLENVAETSYLRYNSKFKGFGGMCLPKDVKALAKLVEDQKVDVGLFDFILNENKKFL
tara:strand:- start:14 stop:781 length:768 start_codon:yes stop_codon:yes gene_type:complete